MFRHVKREDTEPSSPVFVVLWDSVPLGVELDELLLAAVLARIIIVEFGIWIYTNHFVHKLSMGHRYTVLSPCVLVWNCDGLLESHMV